MKQILQLAKLPVQMWFFILLILFQHLTLKMLHFKSVSFLSASAHEDLMKKFNALFIDMTCLSLLYSLVPFFLEETPKALYFPYIAHCSLHYKF